MTPEHAYEVWLLANVLCLVGSLSLLFGSSAQLNRTTAIILSIGALGFTPLADNFRWAQSQVFALFGVLLFFRSMQRGRDGAAGALLAALGLCADFHSCPAAI